MKCERCNKPTPPNSFELHDYCAVCSKNLCESCMAEGCCGNVPAKSGQADDHGGDEEEGQS
jgi:hypothetical protein